MRALSPLAQVCAQARPSPGGTVGVAGGGGGTAARVTAGALSGS